MTTGVLLQKLINGTCSQYTHFILDEVHERDLDTDFVLLIMKIKSFSRQFKSKVVLMSATINTKMFGEYFAEHITTEPYYDNEGNPLESLPAPVITIRSSVYNIQEFYWDELANMSSSPIAPFIDQIFLKRYQELYANFGFVEFDQLLGRRKFYPK